MLFSGPKLLQPSSISSHFLGCKFEETGLHYLRCFQHRTLSEERAAAVSSLVQRMKLGKLHQDAFPPWGVAGFSPRSSVNLEFKIFI